MSYFHFNCIILFAEPIDKPKITPNGEFISFDERVAENSLTCEGHSPVAWYFPRDLNVL